MAVTNSVSEVTPDPKAAPTTIHASPQDSAAASPRVEAIAPRPKRFDARKLRIWAVLLLIAFAAYLCFSWLFHRMTHSVTEDAFVEAHIVNVAPQQVSGRLVGFLVDENDR